MKAVCCRSGGEFIEDFRRRAERIDVSGRDFDRNLHLARVEGKRIRAALRMLKPQLGRLAFHKYTRMIKKASRLLSERRDLTIIGKHLSKIGIQIDALALGRTPSPKRELKRLRAIRSTLLRTADYLTKKRISVTRDLQQSALRESALKMKRSFKHARSRAKRTDFHRWRKSVKAVFFQMQFARRPSPSDKKHIEELNALQNLLGKAHDIEITRKVLRTARTSMRVDIGAACQQLRREQKRLQKRALKVGKALS